MLALTAWPNLSELLKIAPPRSPMQIIVEGIDEARSIRAMFNFPNNERFNLQFTNFNSANTHILFANAMGISRLANSSVTIVAPEDYGSPVKLVTLGKRAEDEDYEGFSYSVPVDEGIVTVRMPETFEVASQRIRLENELAKCDADIARVDQKLGNADFVKRAPEEVVEGEREKRAEAQARKTKIAEALERLKGAA